MIRPMVLIPAFLLVLLFAVPLALPYGTFAHLDGSAGIMDHWDLWRSSDPLSGTLYAFGDMLCHQMYSRSFILNGSQMAFCSRDVSVLAGVLAGAVVAVAAPRLVGRKCVTWASVLMLMPMIAEWFAERAELFDSLTLRVVTGVMAGVGLAMLAEVHLIRPVFSGPPDGADV